MSYSNIKFGDNLMKNKTCKITYTGHLFQNGSEFVNIVYGFDPEFAYDRHENTRAFKHVKDESKILALQKKGIFN